MRHDHDEQQELVAKQLIRDVNSELLRRGFTVEGIESVQIIPNPVYNRPCNDLEIEVLYLTGLRRRMRAISYSFALRFCQERPQSIFRTGLPLLLAADLSVDNIIMAVESYLVQEEAEASLGINAETFELYGFLGLKRDVHTSGPTGQAD